MSNSTPGFAPAEDAFRPPEPTTIEETGLGLGFLSDLALKILYFQGYVTGAAIADKMCLPFMGVIERIMEFLKREMLCEIKGARRPGPVLLPLHHHRQGDRSRPRDPGARAVRRPGPCHPDRIQRWHPGPTDAHLRDPRERHARVGRPPGGQRHHAGATGTRCQLGPLHLFVWRARQRQDRHRREHRPGGAGRRDVHPLRRRSGQHGDQGL